MAIIELDDGLYLYALGYLGRRSALGVIEGFHGFLDFAGVAYEPNRRACIDGLLAAMGDDQGDYTELERTDEQAAQLRRVVWSYQRAWIDRFGFADSISQSKSTGK